MTFSTFYNEIGKDLHTETQKFSSDDPWFWFLLWQAIANQIEGGINTEDLTKILARINQGDPHVGQMGRAMAAASCDQLAVFLEWNPALLNQTGKLCASHNNIEAVKFLLTKGCDIDTVTEAAIFGLKRLEIHKYGFYGYVDASPGRRVEILDKSPYTFNEEAAALENKSRIDFLSELYENPQLNKNAVYNEVQTKLLRFLCSYNDTNRIYNINTIFNSGYFEAIRQELCKMLPSKSFYDELQIHISNYSGSLFNAFPEFVGDFSPSETVDSLNSPITSLDAVILANLEARALYSAKEYSDTLKATHCVEGDREFTGDTNFGISSSDICS